MKTLRTILIATLAACASSGTVKSTGQLAEARKAYAEARASGAAAHAPDAFRAAADTLNEAELLHREDPGSNAEAHAAYLATRRAQVATARANTVTARTELEQRRARYTVIIQEHDAASRDELSSTSKELAHKNAALAQRDAELAKRNADFAAQNQQLDERNKALKDREAELAKTTEALEAEKQARAKLEAERDEAMTKLKEFASVVENERGTVITLGSELLFRSGESTLMPNAQAKLDKVATALKALETDQSLVIEGHADSRGSAEYNRRLSRDRADAVRAYLVTQGVGPDKVIAVGKGEEAPVASNTSAEGRANNRRVEIVISRSQSASK